MFDQNNDQPATDNQPLTDNGATAAVEPGATVSPAADQAQWQHPGTPLAGSDAATSAPLDTPAAQTASANSDDLLDIKQQALSQLSPLVGHLDQTAEEKFRTTMMMIQASDNQALIRQAYEAALAIEDEKTRAQALLDIVNEINYFTQQHQ